MYADTTQEMAEAVVIAKEQTRQLGPMWRQAVLIIAVAFVLFHVYTAGYQLFFNVTQRSIHMGFALTLGLLLFPPRKGWTKGKVPVYDLILILLIVFAVAYTVINSDHLLREIKGSSGDLASAAIFLLVILEVTRRIVGPILPAMVVVVIIYALFGSYIPGHWGLYPSISPDHLLEQLYMGTRGFFGVLMNLSATLIAMFVILASFLLFSGGGRAFMGIALLVAGRFSGGAAKVATIASALFGTISGSTTANVAATGSFTIPTMKRFDYKPEFAAGVEATASSGGQIMPPIMGIAAFIMPEFLGIRYLDVITAAAIPAALYFLGVFLAVHFEARRVGLRKVAPEMIPSARSVLKLSYIAPVILPLLLLLIFLFQGYTPMKCAFYATAAGVVLYLGSAWDKRLLVERLKSFKKIAQGSAMSLTMVVPLLACAQVLISLFGMTGIGVKFSGLVMSLSGDNMALALFLAMVVCMILGCGISSAAAYLLSAAVVGPALILMAADPLAAHMFLFYFSVFGSITPPVCVGVFMASAIANCDWIKTAWIAMRLGAVAFIVPFLFIYSPELLLIGEPLNILLICASTTVGVIAFAGSLMGFLVMKLRSWERIILLASAMLMFIPGWLTSILGIILLVGVYLRQRFGSKWSEPLRLDTLG